MIKAVKKFLDNFKNINDYYNYLIDKTKKKEYVGITNEWLIDNFYLLVEKKVDVSHNRKYITKKFNKIDDLYNTIKALVLENNYNINFDLLTKGLRTYQRQEKKYFSYEEISCIQEILLFVYTERLSLLCSEERSKLKDKALIASIIKDNINNDVQLDIFFNKEISIPRDRYYIFELNNQLKDSGNNILFKKLIELLETQQISLKQLINDEHQRKVENSILISNIFNNLKEFVDYNEERLFKHVSKTEKMFLDDEVYSKMTVESKKLYRDK